MSNWFGGTGPHDLIAGDRVRGTPVFTKEGVQLGVLEELVLDKLSGQVAFVLVSCGGFLGLGSSLQPAPWGALSFDMQVGGYVLNMPEDQLRAAPSYGGADALSKDYAAQVRQHYAPAGDNPSEPRG